MRAVMLSTIGDLADDLRAHALETRKKMPRVVRKNLQEGNAVARSSARRKARRHGRHYFKAFGYEMHGITSSLEGQTQYSGEYGPDPSMPQGDMEFEGGSRNQPPHHNLAHSRDVQGPKFASDVARLGDGLLGE